MKICESKWIDSVRALYDVFFDNLELIILFSWYVKQKKESEKTSSMSSHESFVGLLPLKTTS